MLNYNATCGWSRKFAKMITVCMLQITVRDVIWMIANGLHLCKWTLALIQVTLSPLNTVRDE